MYISLHNHSDGSLLDGYQTVQEMVSRAKSLGMSAISLTDHGTMRNIIRFYEECTKNDIKPIVGCEFYFCPDVNIRDKSLTHHLVLLAMNDEGYMNLKKLDTFAYDKDSYYYKPRIDWEHLRRYSKGLICLSACMASIVNTENGEEWFKKYKELFQDRFYAEIQPLNLEKQWAYNDKVIGLARKYNVPLVVTTDAHYSIPEDKVYHSHWIRINGNQYHDDENYIWSEDEIRNTQWIPREVIDECIENTKRIAESCNVVIPDSGSHYPKYPCSNPKEKVREICRSHWRELVPKGKYKEYAERFEVEMKDLEATNYLEYLLIIWSVLSWCKEQHIPLGEGRGCSISGTKVLMWNGTVKNIEDIVVGDKVISHTGQIREVTKTFKYKVNEPMTQVTVENRNPMTFTCDHKILVFRGSRCDKKKTTGYKYCRPTCLYPCRKYGSYEWIPMSEVEKDDLVCFPQVHLTKPNQTRIDLKGLLPEVIEKDGYVNVFSNDAQWDKGKIPRYIDITPDLCRLIGYFIGNGWTTKQVDKDGTKRGYSFGIAFPTTHMKYVSDCRRLLKSIFNVDTSVKPNKRNTCVQIHCYRSIVGMLFAKLCGVHAINKHIPDILMTDNPLWAVHLLEGLMRTDGSVAGGRTAYDSISYNLVCQIKTLWSYLGRSSAIRIRNVTHKNWHTSYKLVLHSTSRWYGDNMYHTEVKDVKHIDNFKGYVYDFTTDVDHSYVANNTVVHNSSAGCLVGYLMGIHKIDPIKYHTEFFRFCNRERRSPADVDSDLSTLNRGRVIEHVKEMYGNVCKVQTLGYTKDPDKPSAGKEAVLKAWQALFNKYRTDENIEDADWEYAPKFKTEASKLVVDSIDDLQDAPISLNKKQKAELIDVAKHFCGRIDKIGVHASAVLVTPDDLVNYTPVEGCYSNDTSTKKRVYLRTACYSFHELEQRGNLKLDLLGLNTLDLIDKCLKYVGNNMNLDDIPMDDEKAYAMYSSGNLDGVFQMESPGMRKVAKELHVSCFDDVAALVALYRPGPLDSGMMQQYIDGKNGADIDYLCDAYKEVTKNTFGVIVYQEQCMKLAMKMAGYSLGEADMLRKVIGRKEMTKIDAAVKEFIARCMEHGYTHEIAEKVGMQIKAAGRYLFNKCLSGRECVVTHTGAKTKRSIRELYRFFHDDEYNKSQLDPYGVHGVKACSMNGDGKIVENYIVDVRESGVMPVFILETESGKQVRCTLNHKIPTPHGKKLLVELSVGDSVYVSDVLDTHIESIVSITYECDEMCYDVEMDNPYHNFVTSNGIVVCNSHSVAYGRLSYKTAYLKAHYPVQFMCALLNTKDKQEDVLPYVANCKAMGIHILPPSLIEGNREWEMVGNNAIRVGLTYIKGVGKRLNTETPKTWKDIVAYNSSDVVKSLICAGALDFLDKSRGWMMANLLGTQKFMKRMAQCNERFHYYLDQYDNATNDKDKTRAIRMANQWNDKINATFLDEKPECSFDCAAGEMKVLGFSFTNLPDILTGVASSVHEITTKNGNKMALVTFKTDYGDFKGSIAPFLWGQGKTRYGRNKLFVVQGKTYDFMLKKNGQYTDIVDVKEVC